MRRSIPALLVTGTATTMAFSACSPANPAAQPAATPTASSAVATRAVAGPVAVTATVTGAAGGSAAVAGTFQGASADMQWGPVQTTIVVKGKRITDVRATAPTERARSAYINGIAVPMLRQEVLQAKTVADIKNIYAVSGATMTSQAFYQSLLDAMQQAHLS
ncbi:MAG TPA: FMN-binding protein [Chloroflexota bacterium]|nr:FMN-binding protein [Chloroflexota bacterium]